MLAQSAAPIRALKKLSLDELLEIEVTSVSRRPEKLLETPSAIQVVTSEEIRRAGASSLPQALRLAGNLDVAQKNAHDWGISARGFNTELSNKLLVMIDGRTVYTPLFSGVVWDNQDYLLEDIDRIEVISGPGGTLWGANAVNGVINITSKTAKETQGLYLEGGIGSELQRFAGARYGMAVGADAHLRVYAKYFDHDNAALANGLDANDAWHRTQAGFRFDAATSATDSVTVQGDYYEGHSRLLAGGRDAAKGMNLLGRWVHDFGSDSQLRVQVYFDRTDIAQPVAAFALGANVLAPAGTFRDQLDTFDIDLQHSLRFGTKHHIVWGAGYRSSRNEVTNAPALAFFPTRLNRNEPSAFVQDTIAFSDRLALTIGTKIEEMHYTGTEFEPSARLSFHANERHSVWAAVSRAVRTPSRIDRDLAQGAPPVFVLLAGGPNFDSEEVIAYELGWRAEFNPRATVALSAFYNEYDDVRSAQFSPVTTFPIVFANGLEGENYGFEFTSTFQLSDHWRVRFDYSVLKQDIRIKPGHTDINNALNEVSDPEQRLGLRAWWDISENLEFSAGVRWIDDRPGHSGPTPGTLPDYWEANARIGWRFNENVEFSIVGQNLLHDQHSEYGFPSATMPAIQRSVYAKIAWRL